MASTPDFQPQFVILSGSGEASVVSLSADFFLLTDGTAMYATYSLDGGHTWFPILNNQSMTVRAEVTVRFKWNLPPDLPAQLMVASVPAK